VGDVQHVQWHEYTIDTALGRLTGNLSLASKFYQCYLHAVTSHCLPDPLLGYTGTEESLNMLQSAAFLSFQRLGENEAKLLQLIGDLTPSRVYKYSWLTVEWNQLPVLSQHHDFRPAVVPILKHAAALEALCDKPVDFQIPDREDIIESLVIRIRTERRNKVYYPRDLQTSSSILIKEELEHSRNYFLSKLRFFSGHRNTKGVIAYLKERLERLNSLSSSTEDIVYKSRDAASVSGTAELAAYQASWSVWNDRPYLSRKWRKPWDAMQSWDSLGPAEEGISLRYNPYWINREFLPSRDWLKIYDLCQEALNGNSQESRIRLAFSLSAASFSGTRYTDLIPLILILATDTRFHGRTRPPLSHYRLSDGTYPDHQRLANMMSESALPLGQTPAQTMEVRATFSEADAKKERKQKYDTSISKIASNTAKSTIERWPERWCDIPHQWFDTQRCKERVEAYLESISRNIDLRDYLLRLQDILRRRKATIPPPKTPYVFSPQVSAAPRKPQKWSAPSIRDVLVSRTNFLLPPLTREHPPSGLAVLPSSLTIVTECNPPSPREDGLISLIHELRHSLVSLPQIYGEDLRASYDDLLAKGASFFVQRDIPPREALLKYHDLCSKQKDTIFSEFLETLAPSQKLENDLGISGLWPRITPRSILRQLSKDHVHTLPDQWKHAITRYAVAFLKCQQSKRLLELSWSNRNEELLRELGALCEPVAITYSPDWLLIQVSRFSRAASVKLQILNACVLNRSAPTFWPVHYN